MRITFQMTSEHAHPGVLTVRISRRTCGVSGWLRAAESTGSHGSSSGTSTSRTCVQRKETWALHVALSHCMRMAITEQLSQLLRWSPCMVR